MGMQQLCNPVKCVTQQYSIHCCVWCYVICCSGTGVGLRFCESQCWARYQPGYVMVSHLQRQDCVYVDSPGNQAVKGCQYATVVNRGV